MADLSLILDRTLAIATIAAPMVILVALLCLVAARTWAAPPRAASGDDLEPRWQLDR